MRHSGFYGACRSEAENNLFREKKCTILWPSALQKKQIGICGDSQELIVLFISLIFLFSLKVSLLIDASSGA